MAAVTGTQFAGAAGQQALDPRLLSIVVPAYNEGATVGHILGQLLALRQPKLEVLVVDDGSSDDTLATARSVASLDPRVRVLCHERNEGKGAAIRTALPHVRGDVVAIQDADLEYDPSDLVEMYARFRSPGVEVVYGSRWSARGHPRRWSSYLASRFLTALTNLLFRARLSDEATGYKMFRTSVLRSLGLSARGFEFCPEVTAKVLLSGREVYEIPISYEPRSYAQGKKISWIDGVRAVATLIRLRLRHRSQQEGGGRSPQHRENPRVVCGTATARKVLP